MASMPALFIGHGSPMNTLADNRFTRAWRQIGAALPRPRALLVISAHWYIGATAVTAMERPRTIHDFYGFPPELFAFRYPAPGAPDVADEVAETVKPLWVGLDQDQWGLDHGTWSVLAHLFPAADVPVVQLSLNIHKPLEYHLDLAARLSPLREQGILIVASGNVVHNLRLVDWRLQDTGFDWAHRFDDAVHERMTSDASEVLAVQDHPDYKVAVPSPDHFLPLLYLAGLAASGGGRATAPLRGYSLGSLSMTAYGLDLPALSEQAGEGSAGLPKKVPADNTNT
ncbi:MAG TPA: 4,5-DOPA dioxygenase extradiol [Gammaproteobacteria bacterium]|nr:4,5-DOPA dioxygenase extradiol [Gammaproteobacteria bacterium]